MISSQNYQRLPLLIPYKCPPPARLQTDLLKLRTKASQLIAFTHKSKKETFQMAPNLTKGTADVCSVGDAETDHPPAAFALKGRHLTVRGHPVLLDVPPDVTVAEGKAVNSVFLGLRARAASSRHVAPLGRLPPGCRFMSIFRFKVWWTTLWTGARGSDLEHETQFLMLDRGGGRGPYVALLPIVSGRFRASLQPGEGDCVDLCLESGSGEVEGSEFDGAVYVHAGDDPFKVAKEAARAVREHLGTFRVLEEKSVPGIVDKFGWCTWDAFYLEVHPEGVWDGVRRLTEGGCPPGLVLIDDGWQSISHDADPTTDAMNLTVAGEQMPCRLISFEENHKFKDYAGRTDPGSTGLGAFVRDLKTSFPAVEHVYVWHALCGYWGGVRPNVRGMPEARLVKPRLSEGLEMTMEDLAVNKIVEHGVGLVGPEKAREMYEGLHARLHEAGIDGVKVDVIHILEMLCEEYGGRVELAKAYFKALTESVRKHFKGNGVIASMEHCNDFMYLGTETISLGRVGDDFWCTDPAGDPNGTFWLQGCHMVHCAYNSLWMGNFIHPDWDMFQSMHPCAAFHAASRAISGGPIYVSDSVGQHDFKLLKSLALPDGTILRCEHYALPTRDCLFEDPLQDGKTVLKIWNLNKYTGALGAFNCQGGGWSRSDRKNKCASEFSHTITAKVKPNDVEWKNGKIPIPIPTKGTKLFAVYSSQASKLALLEPEEEFEITLPPFNFELFVVSPVKMVSSERDIQFAAIGLVNMLNAGGAIQKIEFDEKLGVKVEVKGAGMLKAYSTEKPAACRINGEEVKFVYDEKMVAVEVPWSGSSAKYCVVEYFYHDN